ncbi:hypothetical protein AB8B02_18580 [Tardiphaga sp. 862_B3_N4_1]
MRSKGLWWTITAFFHFPFPGLGRLLKTDGAYAWVPANWQF